MQRRPRRRRLGLRARITVIYALGALLMSSLVAVSTFTLTQARLVNQAEEAAKDQVFRNAMDLRRRLQSVPPDLLIPATDEDGVALDELATEQSGGSDPEPSTTLAPTTEPRSRTPLSQPVDTADVLEALGVSTTLAPGSGLPTVLPEAGPIEPADAVTSILGTLLYTERVDSLLVLSGRDRSLSGLRTSDVPNGLRYVVENGQPASQLYRRNDTTLYALGVPIIAVDASGATAQYYEITSFADLQSTLNLLQVILGGTALAASLAGAALGWYSARRTLQPLVDASTAAEAIARGQLDTRLDDQVDPDLARITSSFNDMVDALRSRIERDSRFASDVSHELRSPLMTLAASVGVLEGRRGELPPAAQQAVDLLGQEVRRFEQLVADLLEISRLDVGAVQLERDPVVLSEFLRFVVARSPTPDVPVVDDPLDPDLVLLVDKRRLAQAISNLLDNARKYGDTATEVGFRHIVVDDDRTRDTVEIHVEDRGPGVPVSDRERIFDRFTRATGDAGRRELTTGVGLGLSLVAEHVRLHGGLVWVTDRPDGATGARFVVSIPAGDDLQLDEERAL